MKLPSLAGFQAGTGFQAAAGADLRLADKRDTAGLDRLLSGAFPELAWSAGQASKVLFEDPSVAAVYVIEGPDGLLATASARYHAPFAGSGYVHWVGVDPRARGRALGTAVMAAVLARFAADRYQTAVLETDDPRLAAISSYLGQGFVPQYPQAGHEERWSGVFAAIAAWRNMKRKG